MNIKNATINQQLASVAVVVAPPFADAAYNIYISVMDMRTTGVPSVQFRVIPLGGWHSGLFCDAYIAAADAVTRMVENAAANEQTVYDYLHQQVRDYLEGR